MFKVVLFILISMAPCMACLVFAWRSRLIASIEPSASKWRSTVLTVGIVPATVCQFLVLAFLIHGFHADEQSFAEPVSLPWAVLNWISVFTWASAAVSVLIGKGSLRRPLFLWSLIIPFAAYLVVMMGYDY
jgi:hypothetical protein